MLVVLDFGYVGKRHLLFRCANPLCQQLPFPSGGHLVCRRIARSVPASFFGAKQRYRSRDYRRFDHRTWLRSCSAPQRAARSPRQKHTSRKRPANRQRTRCPQGSNPAARLRLPNCLRFQHARQRGYPGKRARHVRPFNLASPASCRQRHCGWLYLRPH